MLSLRVILDVPLALVVFVTRLLAAHRARDRHSERDACPDLLEAGGLSTAWFRDRRDIRSKAEPHANRPQGW